MAAMPVRETLERTISNFRFPDLEGKSDDTEYAENQ
jgi:hypothetical protein